MPGKSRTRLSKQRWLVNKADQPSVACPPPQLVRRRKRGKKRKEEENSSTNPFSLEPSSETDLSTRNPNPNNNDKMAKTASTPKNAKPDKATKATNSSGKVTKACKTSTPSGKVTTTKRSTNSIQKRVLANAIPGELAPYICYIEDNDDFFDMVEQATRPVRDCVSGSPVVSVALNKVAKVIQPASLADLAAIVLSTKPKRVVKRAQHSKPSKELPTDTKEYPDLPVAASANQADLPHKLAVKRSGIEPTMEEGTFNLALSRKSWRLLKKEIDLPSDFFKGKNVKKKIRKRIDENTKKMELLQMLHETINLNVQISGTSNTNPIDVDTNDGENAHGEGKEEDEASDIANELRLHTPEVILTQFEKAEAAMATVKTNQE